MFVNTYCTPEPQMHLAFITLKMNSIFFSTYKKVKADCSPAHSHRASKWQSQDSNPGLWDVTAPPLTPQGSELAVSTGPWAPWAGSVRARPRCSTCSEFEGNEHLFSEKPLLRIKSTENSLSCLKPKGKQGPWKPPAAVS